MQWSIWLWRAILRSFCRDGRYFAALLPINCLFAPLMLGLFAYGDALSMSVQQAQTKLVGGGSKEWILVSVEIFLDRGGQCKQGKTYTFNKDSTVTIKRCVDGTWECTRVTWSLSDKNDLDRVLKIGDEEFLITFRNKGKEENLRLRKRPAHKVETTKDIVLRHRVDD